MAITDANGAVLEKRLFDAWGSIAQVQDGNNNILNVLTILDRGYTGHEHLQSVGLIDMNARLYDPKLHRFLQPDNYVQDPSNSQNYNRYGYVLNNPLANTDPSGEETIIRGGNCPCEQPPYNGPNFNGAAYDWLEANKGGDGWLGRNFSARNFDRAGTAVGKAARDATNFVVSNIARFFGGGGSAPEMHVAQQSNMSANITPSASNNFSTGAVSIRNNAMVSQYEEHSIIPANTVGGYGNGLNGLDSAMSIGGGIYNSLGKVVVSSSGQWLGNNGNYYKFIRGANQYTGSSTGAFEAARNYTLAGRATVLVSIGIGGVETYNGYQLDGQHFGYNAQHAAASSAGGLLAGWAGFETGAAVGVWADGVGAIPGAIIGFIFGYYGGQEGSAVGGDAVDYIHKR